MKLLKCINKYVINNNNNNKTSTVFNKIFYQFYTINNNLKYLHSISNSFTKYNKGYYFITDTKKVKQSNLLFSYNKINKYFNKFIFKYHYSKLQKMDKNINLEKNEKTSDNKNTQLKKPKESKSGMKEKYKREELENVLLRRFFIVPSFEIYGGIAGLYDFGPPGCAVKINIEQYWRKHFILEENMLELGCSNLTPYSVLKSSGHVDQFSDFMVKDVVTGEFYRADKIVQEFIDKTLEKNEKTKKLKQEDLQKYKRIHSEVEKVNKPEEIDAIIKELKVKSAKNNDLSKASHFNLMFGTQIGPDEGSKGFLRPETAQGQFVNFRRLLEYNGGKLPFASATVGIGFRNEISPRSGLLRGREFFLAEIEHFLDPRDKSHKKFSTVKDLTLPLWSKETQKENKLDVTNNLTLEHAVNKGIINCESLAYYMGRTYLFLITVGINKESIRFRQHNDKEMAHYACDCWDAEVETSYGWIEVVGHADRTCYDLDCHSKSTNKEHVGTRLLKEPIVHNKVRIETNKPKLSKQYKDKMKRICDTIDKMTEDDKEKYLEEFNKNKKVNLTLNKITEKDEDIVLEISEDLLSFKRYTETQSVEKFVPGVIEPAFGIGRIVYCVFEHCFKVRKEDNKRTYFDFPPVVAPYKVSILPLINSKEMYDYIETLRKSFVNQGISYKIDDIAEGIGKRYARTDEVGIPFACTIDEKTIKDGSVTLRNISNMKQVRIHVRHIKYILIILIIIIY